MRAHVRRALQDRLLQGADGAGMNVLGREARLGFGSFGDRLFEIALVRLNPIEDAGFIEVNVRLDKTRRDQAAADIDGFALGREPALDGGDPSASDADVGQLMLGADYARVSENEIHYSLTAYSIRRSQCGAAVAQIGAHQSRIATDLVRSPGMNDGA